MFHSPFTIHRLPLTIHHSPFTIHHSPFTIHHLPFTIMNRYTPFFAAIATATKRGLTKSRDEVVAEFTEGRTSSVKDLSDYELQELCRRLNALSGSSYTPTAGNQKADKMRKSIIAIFYSMNKTAAQAKAWAEKQGIDGIKKPFNAYKTQELWRLIRIAEMIKQDHDKVLRKTLAQ